MKRSDKFNLKISETRSALNDLVNSEDFDTDKAEGLEKDLKRYELRYRQALREEALQNDNDGEPAAKDRLLRRAELRSYFAAALDGERVEGAELELNQSLQMKANEVPWVVIAPRATETRADAVSTAPTTVGINQRPAIPRVFANSTAAFLGVDFVQVGAGESLIPVVSAGASPKQLAAGGDHGDTAALTLSTVKQSAVRAQIMLKYRHEDVANFGQSFESILRRDMTSALVEHTDKMILTGSGSSNQPTGLWGGTTAPTAAGTLATYSTALSPFSGLVDGRYAAGESELKAVIGSPTYSLFGTLYANNNKGDVDANTALRSRLGGYRVSAHVPAMDATDKTQEAVVKLGMSPGAVASMWPSVKMIRDEATEMDTGIIRLSMIQLWQFSVVRAASYARLSFKIAS